MDRWSSNGRGVAMVLAVVLAAASLAAPARLPAQEGAAAAGEEREAIVVPEAGRTAVLREMRQMLTALNGVLTAMAAGDRAAVAEAARSGGTRIAVDRGGGLTDVLPEAFMRLGMSTHRGFDGLAAAAERGVSRDSLLARMGTLTSKCVSCHASYRLEASGGGGSP